ncbi:MAG: Serine/threonine-protein kinase PrkC, partial [Planctomycetota bacterium]
RTACMTERTLFLSALEINDPRQREAYLDRQCNGNAALRRRVTQLLASHARADQFLESPAVDIAADHLGYVEALLSDNNHGSPDQPSSGSTESSEEADVRTLRSYVEKSARPDGFGTLGIYDIDEVFGHGAFGIVARATDTKLLRQVAVKVLRPEYATTSPPRQRFLREARTTAAIRHENVIGIYAVEESPLPYIVMEYVAGETLLQRLDRIGPLEVEEVLRIGHGIASGLAAAHAVKLIHRDIKPSNILIADDPAMPVKITDFGLARTVDDASMTSSGQIAGTPMYMSPEQARGEPLDHRGDLFSLGSVMYHMVTGRAPFRAANSVAVLKRVCEDTPRPINDVLPDVPDWLCAIINRLLEKKPQARFQSAQEVADLLARCQRELKTTGKVTSVRIETIQREPARVDSPLMLWANAKSTRIVAVAAVVALAAFLGWHVASNQQRERSTNGTHSASASTVPTESSSWSVDSPRAFPTISSKSRSPDGSNVSALVPLPAEFPIDAEAARTLQASWSAYLGVPVEHTNSLGMKFVLIPPGEFTMGAPELHSASSPDELPPHRVRITQPFYLGTTPVTQRDYETVVGMNPSSNYGPLLPVDHVSWHDANRFCELLAQGEGLGDAYRLPTEAEWEYACRAGSAARFPWGDDETLADLHGWFASNCDGQTQAVAQKLPNAFGLCDMLGNIRQMCRDNYSANYYRKSPLEDPPGPDQGDVKVWRGGMAREAPWSSYTRDEYASQTRNDSVGFRVVLPLDAVRGTTAAPVTPDAESRVFQYDLIPPRSVEHGQDGTDPSVSDPDGEADSDAVIEPPTPYRVVNAVVAREASDVTYWHPAEPKQWAEIVYQIESPFPIGQVVEPSTTMVKNGAWRIPFLHIYNKHADATLDQGASGIVEISLDDATWT